MAQRRPQTRQERELLAKATRYIPGGTLGNLNLPQERSIIIKAGKGAHVYDVSGNEYVDYLLGSGPMILGHSHPAVTEAVREAVGLGTTFYAINEPIIHLAEELVRAIPCADKVRFTTSGTEANFQCLRVARAVRKRDKVLKFEGGYHGSSDYAMISAPPSWLAPYPTPVPSAAGIPKAVAETVLVAPFNDLETTSGLIEKHHDELAAVILEPFQRVLPPRPGFLQGLRQVTAQYEIPLIFDEVVTGFRFAYGGAQEYYGVTPDLAAFGKIIGGGFPLAAVVGREEFMRYYDPEFQGTPEFIPQIGTLSGNPVSAVAGLATLRELQKPGVYQRLYATGEQLMGTLARLLQEAEVPAQVIGVGPLFDVYFTGQEIWSYRDTLKADGKKLMEFHRLLLEHGVFKSLQKFYVSLAHTREDVDWTIAAFQAAIEQLRG